jgi:hypothetical protein
MGPTGVGKTRSIGTLVDSGIEVFFLAIESGMESLLGYWTDRGLPIPPNLHWHKLGASEVSFEDMIANATKINTYNLESLAKMADPNRAKHNQYITLLEALHDFPDDRTGERFGDVSTWDSSRAIVIDGMAGINNCTMSLVIGGKPVRNQSDWGIAQGIIVGFLRKLCDDCKCWFVLLSHVSRETDQVLGGVKITVDTLGKAIAGQIPPMFSDVILAVRDGGAWSWDTASTQADVKTRNLPISGKIEPNFGQIVTKWRSRNVIDNPAS